MFMLLLINTAVLLYKTKDLSWRVNDEMGQSVRALVQADHCSLDYADDDIARRILALGRTVPANSTALIKH